jgi:hypothetical protein
MSHDFNRRRFLTLTHPTKVNSQFSIPCIERLALSGAEMSRNINYSQNKHMSDLIVVGFKDEFKADEVMSELRRLQSEYLVDLEDAAGSRCGYSLTVKHFRE